MDENYPTHAACYHTPGEGPFANYYFGLCWASHHVGRIFLFLYYLMIDPPWWPIQQFPITGTDKLAFSSLQTNLPTPLSPTKSSITPRVATPTKDRYCRFCSVSFYRWQDRDRHELTHLPYFFHCPLPHCEWRGNRLHTFKTHWQQEDHRPYHESYGHSPKRSQIETYDPRPILRNGDVSFSEAEDQAIFWVQVKAYELQKPGMWADPRGRSRKQALRCR
jgi:hypothetical protein